MSPYLLIYVLTKFIYVNFDLITSSQTYPNTYLHTHILFCLHTYTAVYQLNFQKTLPLFHTKRLLHSYFQFRTHTSHKHPTSQYHLVARFHTHIFKLYKRTSLHASFLKCSNLHMSILGTHLVACVSF